MIRIPDHRSRERTSLSIDDSTFGFSALAVEKDGDGYRLWVRSDTSDQTIVDNVVGQEGRRFLLVRAQYSSETEGAQIAFDITGPWR